MWVSELKNRNTNDDVKIREGGYNAEREDKLKELEKITGETVIRPEVPDYIAKNQKWSHSRQNTEETDNWWRRERKKWLKCSLWLKTLKQ